MRRARPVLAAAALLLVTGCTSDDSSGPGYVSGGEDGASPEAAAQVYADALASGDFADVSFVGGEDPAAVGEEYATIVNGLGELEPTVSVADVSERAGAET